MGNRAVITTPEKQIGLYLHWNGGRDSVEPMLKYCEMKGYRAPNHDNYGWARLAQVAGNFFGGSLCVGIDLYENIASDWLDNGVYIIDGWDIVGREYFEGGIEQNEYDFNEMLKEFDKAMPKGEQLGAYLDAPEISVSEVQFGDKVYMQDIDGKFIVYDVVGFGDGMVNGRDRTGVPYVNKYGDYFHYKENPNNYVNGKTCRIVPRN